MPYTTYFIGIIIGLKLFTLTHFEIVIEQSITCALLWIKQVYADVNFRMCCAYVLKLLDTHYSLHALSNLTLHICQLITLHCIFNQ